MTTTYTDTDADRALKAKHRALRASGDYPTVAAELIPTLGAVVVAVADIRAGQRVLDVAAGSGNAAIPAVARGAIVTASDLTPELFVARRAPPLRVVWSWTGSKPTPRPCRSPTTASRPSSRSSVRCSHHTTGRPPTRCCACANPAAPSR